MTSCPCLPPQHQQKVTFPLLLLPAPRRTAPAACAAPHHTAPAAAAPPCWLSSSVGVMVGGRGWLSVVVSRRGHWLLWLSVIVAVGHGHQSLSLSVSVTTT